MKIIYTSSDLLIQIFRTIHLKSENCITRYNIRLYVRLLHTYNLILFVYLNVLYHRETFLAWNLFFGYILINIQNKMSDGILYIYRRNHIRFHDNQSLLKIEYFSYIE